MAICAGGGAGLILHFAGAGWERVLKIIPVPDSDPDSPVCKDYKLIVEKSEEHNFSKKRKEKAHNGQANNEHALNVFEQQRLYLSFY